jgi:hypothetical protein
MRRTPVTSGFSLAIEYYRESSARLFEDDGDDAVGSDAADADDKH